MVNEYGVIVPSTEDMNKAIGQLVAGIQNNDAVNTRFRTAPVQYFKSLGIPSDAVAEVMKEVGLSAEARYAGNCSYTCIWTCWYTGYASASISLQATATPLRSA